MVSIRVIREVATRRSLCYGYVNFQKHDDAARAINELNFEEIGGSSVRIMWSQRDSTTRKSGVGNIFIKNLEETIDNRTLYDTFSYFGNIISCKVCVDEEGKSKGYGFIQFDNEESASSAIQNVNGMQMKDKIVFVGKFKPRQEREKEVETSNKGFTNVFIKNFGDEIDEQKLYDIFSEFGRITSHAIMTDTEGRSKGFGFVCFESPESAIKAVEEMNEKEFTIGRPLYVNRAQTKKERSKELTKEFKRLRMEKINKYKGINIYIKNLDTSIDDDKLREEFSPYGNITSAKIMMKQDISRGFGFVCFTSEDEAARAVTEMNGKFLGRKPLYVALAQRKEDRKALLASIRSTQISQLSRNLNYCMPVNVVPQPYMYITPIITQTQTQPPYLNQPLQDAQVELRPQLLPQSQLLSGTNHRNQYPENDYYSNQNARPRFQPNQVARPWSQPDQVARPWSQTDQIARPWSQSNQAARPRFQVNRPRFQTDQNTRFSFKPSEFAQMRQRPPPPLPGKVFENEMTGMTRSDQNVNWKTTQRQKLFGRAPSTGAKPARFHSFNTISATSSHQRADDSLFSKNNQHQQMPNTQQQYNGEERIRQNNKRQTSQYKFSNRRINFYENKRRNSSGGRTSAKSYSPSKSVGNLSSSALASFHPEKQRELLGNSMYPFVYAICPDIAGKITGMLLEMDTTYILKMINDEIFFKKNVEEAVAVLKAQQANPNATTIAYY